MPLRVRIYLRVTAAQWLAAAATDAVAMVVRAGVANAIVITGICVPFYPSHAVCVDKTRHVQQLCVTVSISISAPANEGV